MVIATALLISMAMVSAFKTNDTFTLGFSVFASATLAITLGCIFETSAQLDVWDVRPAIINAMRFGPAPPEIDHLRSSDVPTGRKILAAVLSLAR